MGRIALFLMALASAVQADGWQKLTTDEISALLRGRVVDYASGWQDFRPSGRTLYDAGRESWGYWDARDDLYCSQWPPADGWACYEVFHDAGRVRFLGTRGDITDGVLRVE
ncbi:hypothetical protein [Shimia sp. SDUM112013]|uniref:hypothetical protein n=1 Tax=Shimia sp. SDUM112013 TaxID=3136160 RepID=UPI0032F0160E